MMDRVCICSSALRAQMKGVPKMSQVSLAVIGNCQVRSISDYLAAMLPNFYVKAGFSRDIRVGDVSLSALVSSDIVVVQSVMLRKVKAELKNLGIMRDVITIPTFYFTGFHPDFIYVQGPESNVASPMHNGNSAIALAAWKAGFTVDEAVSLFNDETYRALGYHDHLSMSRDEFLGEAESFGLDLFGEYETWERSGPFLHTPNHPKPMVLGGIARAVVAKLGLQPSTRCPEALLPDQFANHMIWPIYPELTKTVGGIGEYVFKPSSGKRDFGSPLKLFTLGEFVEGSFEVYSKFEPDMLVSARLEDSRYAQVLESFRHRKSGSPKAGSHPYRGLPDYQFWRKAVSKVEMSKMDPVTNAKTVITPDLKIATAGSCFAQHIARALQTSGFNYYVPEMGDALNPEHRKRLQYGLFSCRYGNIYTAAQLNQLYDRAAGDFIPQDTAWVRNDGRFVDPFRPTVEPDGFASPEEVATDRERHFRSVREMWRSLDVFVFTLGLTEAWQAKEDGAVFPLAPGVAGGEMDFDQYEFHNYSVDETVQEMTKFFVKLGSVNPSAKIILTVSPVPLEATYENRNVLVSTTYSKSVLRVAAEDLSRRFDQVEYFPSYEIITGSYTRGAYYAEDLREVLPNGVNHVMSRFLAHHTRDRSGPLYSAAREFREGQEIICDEEMLRRE
jgi:hypothetical protein